MHHRHSPGYPRGRTRRLIRAIAIAIAVAVPIALGGCSAQSASDVVTLNFFQFKPEAVKDFDRIIADFEKQNPKIRVVQNLVPDPDTAIRTLLVKGKVPDVLTLNGSGNFGQLAKAGVFHDFTGDPIVKTINPAVLKIMAALGTYKGKEINGLGFANNADGIIYNKKIFADNHITVPTTWDELIAACDKLKAAGITPFYGTLADAWTVQPAFSGLGAQLGGTDFYPKLRAEGANVDAKSKVSFEKDYATTVDKIKKLYSYAQPGYLSRGYDDGNKAFADGKSAMYLQGIWALAPILTNNPKLQVGAFPYPATNDPSQTRLVSGVDVAVTIGRNTPKMAQAKKFVAYLMSPAVNAAYAKSQQAFSTLADAPANTNKNLAGLVPYFESGRIVGFVDHQIPASIPLAPILQEMLTTGDTKAAMASLDNEWRKVAARTVSTTKG